MLQRTIYNLLTSNATRRLNDAELMAELIRTLAEDVDAVNCITRNRPFSVMAKYRSQYNRGLLLGQAPSVLSVPYADGVPIGRNGLPLSAEKLEGLRKKLMARFPAASSLVIPTLQVEQPAIQSGSSVAG